MCIRDRYRVMKYLLKISSKHSVISNLLKTHILSFEWIEKRLQIILNENSSFFSNFGKGNFTSKEISNAEEVIEMLNVLKKKADSKMNSDKNSIYEGENIYANILSPNDVIAFTPKGCKVKIIKCINEHVYICFKEKHRRWIDTACEVVEKIAETVRDTKLHASEMECDN
eukprot:TRINITY_DN4605_c0_g1_i1.p1 TRINITY_DN4605_c0_g1~~TRINITY_DN4605_c0_g1_i1.p1  ORF type:complete len:170 (+),score=26.14 TRINITY_DN4605_c0_g1_i1:74-583(+)